MNDRTRNDLVRCHPIVGGNHDGNRYRICGFTVLNGERRALLEGQEGCDVSRAAPSRPAAGHPTDPDAPATTKRR